MKDTLGRNFFRAMFKLKSLLSAELSTDGSRGKRRMKPAEYVFLRKIADNAVGADGNTGLAEIRAYLSVTKPAVSQMLASLEKKGYVRREPDPENRRNLIVTLTPRGRERLREMDSVYHARFEQIRGGMGERDMEEMIRLIGRMNDTIHTMNKEDEP